MNHIFVSHATADDGIVSKLHDELEAATGLNMWVDHQDLKPPIANFRAALQEALKTCDAGLLVLSKNIIGRDEIDAEWNYILSTAKRPLYVAKVDDIPPLDMNARLGLVQWVDLNANWEAGIRTLAAYMRGENPPADAPLVPMRKISGIEDRKLLYIPMSGRDKELEETLDKLKREPVMIVGVGGRGKSRLAAEVALRSTDTKGAVWHKVDDISSAEGVIDNLRDHFEMATDAPRKDILAKLKPEKTLVVIDNAESAEEDARRADYCKLVETLLRAGAQVLLTGRAEWAEIDPLGVVRPAEIKETTTAVQILTDMGKVFGSPYDFEIMKTEAEGLARAALMHPRLMEWAVKQTKREAPKDVLKQLQSLQSKDVKTALDEMIHKTLRQMTAATGDDQAEKLLRQLVVFRGAFAMEAAEAITKPQPPPLSPSARSQAHSADSPHTGEERRLDDLRAARNQLQAWQFVTMQADGNEARYRVDGLVLEVLIPDEATHAAHFAYYNGLHGNHNANNDTDRHPLIERDWENVRAALAWGFEHEAQVACDLATALVSYMQFRVSYEIWRETLNKANQAAVKIGYTYGEAQTLQALGDLDRMEAQYAKARENYQAALAAFRLIPSRLGEANTLKALGDLEIREAHYPQARENYQAALTAFRLIPDRLGEAYTLKALGDLDLIEAHYPQARENYQAALAAFRLIPDRLGEAQTLQALGDLDYMEAQYAKARENYQAALAAFRLIPDRLGEANTLQALGDLEIREDQYAKARANYEAALAAFRQIPDRLGEANTLRGLGRLHQVQKEWALAEDSFNSAYQIYVALPSLYNQAGVQVERIPTWLARNHIEEAIIGLFKTFEFLSDMKLESATAFEQEDKTNVQMLKDHIGEDAFITAWKGAMGDAPLPEWLA